MNTKSKWVVLSFVVLIIILIAGCLFFSLKKRNPPFSQTAEGVQVINDFNSNNFDRAISTLQSYLKENPGEESAELLLASSYVQKGSLEFKEKDNGQKALDIVNAVIARDPKNIEAYRIKGYAYEIMQDYSNAFASYNQALSIDPKNAAVLSNRGHAYSLVGQNQNAEKDYESALTINPTLDDALLNLGRLDVSENKIADGEVYLKKVVVTTSNLRLRASALQIIGVAEISSSNFKEAKGYLDEAIATDPNLASAYVERARAIYFLLPETSTKDDFIMGVNYIMDNVQTASSINPNLTSPYLLGANVFEMLGDKKQALSFFNEALSVVSQDISLSSTDKDSTIAEINTKIKTLN